jgi:hypothetical protein
MSNFKVLSESEKILPDGVFEGDIVLSKEQAYDIFSQFIEKDEDALRSKRKVSRNMQLWTMPINYIFDGTHCII